MTSNEIPVSDFSFVELVCTLVEQGAWWILSPCIKFDTNHKLFLIMHVKNNFNQNKIIFIAVDFKIWFLSVVNTNLEQDWVKLLFHFKIHANTRFS